MSGTISDPPSPSLIPPREDIDYEATQWTLLPIIEACDNFKLPTVYPSTKGPIPPLAQPGTSLISRLEQQDFSREKLVPFYVSLPASTHQDLNGNANGRQPSTSSSSSCSSNLILSSSDQSYNDQLHDPPPDSGYFPSSSSASYQNAFDSRPPSPRTLLAQYPPMKFDPNVPIGFLRPKVVTAMIEDNRRMVKNKCRACWKFGYEGTEENVVEGHEREVVAAAFEDWLNEEEGKEGRTEHVDRLVRNWKESRIFPDVLDGWRNEYYPVYGAPLRTKSNANPLPGRNVAFIIERAAASLFGFATYGVHLTAYVPSNPMKIWVPRRSFTKQTWPGYLDNSVAGGLTYGQTPLEAIIRECEEEASLDPSFVSTNIKPAGLVSYTYRSPTSGWIQPELQYIYDLPLPLDDSIVPTTNPSDGEVESFELLQVDEVLEKMKKGEFKPNTAVVLVDFLVRHGLVSSENDARFVEVCTRTRRGTVLPGP